jgi:PAS domain S-box-containing protein
MKEKLNQLEAIYLKAFTLSPDAVNINRLSDGMYVSVNEGFTNITGYTKKETIGKTSSEINIWADMADRDLLVQKLKSEKDVVNMQTRFKMKNGTVREGLMLASIIEIEGVPHILSLTKDITEKHQYQTAISEIELKYHELMDLAPDGILLGSNNGMMTGANSKMLKITGRTLDDLLGNNIAILFSKEELRRVPLRYDLLNEGKTVTNERNILRPDGSTIHVEMHTRMMPDGSYQLICHDITDRLKTENELRKLSMAVEQSPVAILITDPEGTIEYANPKLCESTGFSKDELIGQNPRIWNSHEKSEEELKELWDTIKSGNEWKGEFHNRNNKGELYWEHATISSIKNEKNEITHFLGIKEDITLRKILEEKTIESEKRYRDIFLANPIPAFIYYEDTFEIIEVNEAAVVNYGYTREEFSRMTLKDIRPPEDVPEFIEMTREFRSDVFHSATNNHMRKDGTIFQADLTSHALADKNGRKTRLVMSVDITQRVKAADQMKLAMEKAEASDRLKTTFLNNISHEIRTPLNGIMGFVDIITQPDLSDRDKKDSVLMLVESSNRLLGTITNYMDISLLTSGSMTVVNNTFNPTSILREAFKNYDRLCHEKDLTIFLEIPEKYENLNVSSDREIFQKALNHLLDNAIKFTQSGSIKFGLKNNKGQLEIFVTDTGAGIRKHSLENIFNPFNKGDQMLTWQSDGSGLGLPIAKGMIELLGGNIHVKSEERKGSTFSIVIPSWSQSLKELSPKGAEDSKKTNRKPLILVAEDDETNFFYLNALLRFETGAEVIHASNGREAIEMVKAKPEISMILMDVKMPEIDGLEATRQIKKIRKDLPIIAITAYSMSGDKERVLSSGCDGYISKPINKRSLIEKMEEFLNLRPA